MARLDLAVMVLLLGGGVTASAQIFVTAGSTAPGDYLRGVGVEAWGVGQYELDSAVAERVRVDSFIVLNEYLSAVKSHTLTQQNRARAAKMAKSRQIYAERADRILNAPESRDIMNGDSLNAAIRDLTRGEITRTELRIDPVSLPPDLVRRLPFQFNEAGQTLSLPRLLHQGHAAWPVAFQDDRYARERKAYERAISDAIDQQIEGKVTREVIGRLEKAVAELEQRYHELERQRSPVAKMVIEVRDHIKDLKMSVELVKSQRVEKVVAVLDTYQGSTVEEFVSFLESHKIAFAPAETEEERKAYREVFAALKVQREILEERAKSRGR